MNQKLNMFGVSILLLTLITGTILAFMAGPTSPLTWILIAILVAVPYVYKKIASRRFITWKDEYNVGIDSIDQQHRKLVSLINQLTTAVDYSTGDEFEGEALAQLVDYTKTHFSYEEKLMEDNGYPDFEPHKAQHEKMIKKVNEVLVEYGENRDAALQHATLFLQDWLINHINGTDKQYVSFLRDKGVQ
jgi:hemerythrin-like metal-binding protein